MDRSRMSRRFSNTRLRAAFVLVAAVAVVVLYAGVLDRSYPVRDWLFWRVLGLWALCAYLALACVSAGHLVLVRVFRVAGLPALETLVHSAAVGLIVFVLGMF